VDPAPDAAELARHFQGRILSVSFAIVLKDGVEKRMTKKWRNA
jgi:hypothetical protein